MTPRIEISVRVLSKIGAIARHKGWKTKGSSTNKDQIQIIQNAGNRKATKGWQQKDGNKKAGKRDSKKIKRNTNKTTGN